MNLISHKPCCFIDHISFSQSVNCTNIDSFYRGLYRYMLKYTLEITVLHNPLPSQQFNPNTCRNKYTASS
uniref:Uncharacterized protein n=1 Tax=Anguilla anguilla TaxID=7936 RepID=A0A0E9XKI8_ANGAN